MPTYEYQCAACGHEFEREQRIVEDPIKKCPKCGKNKAARRISQGNFILKGSGWYADLYSSAPPKKKDADTAVAKTDEKKPDAAPEKSADAKTEAKPDAKSADKKDAGPAPRTDKSKPTKTKTKSG